MRCHDVTSSFGRRAKMPPYGAQELLDLELYLQYSSEGVTANQRLPGVLSTVTRSLRGFIV